MLILATERLLIRQFTPNDHEFVLRLYNEETFLTNIGDKGVRNTEGAISHLINGPIASYKEHGFGLYLVCLKNEDTPVGMCGLLKRTEFEHADLGYAFLPEYCGKGFAQEASSVILQESVKNHCLGTVLSVTSCTNTRSNHLLKKLGFTFQEKINFSNTENNLYEINLSTL
ncbi:MAG: RimJ/RimL family protein N-acetyltransferase [Colwellia sp.]|jgi:RimJ/RimL family protein N-acetyltransferase